MAGYVEANKLIPASPRPAKDLIGKPAPELTLQTLAGESLRIADLKGKMVLLDFRAAWRQPCRGQMPQIAALHREFKDNGLAVAGVADDENPEKSLQFLRQHNYDWPNVINGSENLVREGVVVEYEIGSGKSTEDVIRAALKKHGVAP